MDTPRSDRRDFLTGRAAIRSVEALAGKSPACETAPIEAAASRSCASPNAPMLLEVSRSAMACEFQVFLNAGQYARVEEVALRVLDRVGQLELQLSAFLATSELSSINQRAAAGPVLVEGHLFCLLRHAVALYAETNGAFDITARPLSRLWGFTRRIGRIPTDSEIQAARRLVGSHQLVLDPERGTIAFPTDGIELDLGAIGKGYALDRCAEIFAGEGVGDFLIHGGQSSVLAIGNRSGDIGWPIGLRHPLIPERRLGTLRLLNGALGTSSAANHYFHHQGRRYGHVLDPRTGWPADKVLSATVVASDASTADALATAFFVVGVDEGRVYCESHEPIAALFVVAGDRAGEYRIEAIGLNSDQWTPD